MKLITLTAALLAASLSAYAGTDMKQTKDMKQVAPVEQSDAGFYVGVYGGANFSQDNGSGRSAYRDPAFPALGTIYPSSHDSDELGGVGGLKAGYKFESIDVFGDVRLQPAVELEAFYMGTGLPLSDRTTAPIIGVTTTTSNANVDSVAGMANSILNFKLPWHLTPYIGAGVGAEYISLTGKTFNDHIFGGGTPIPTLHKDYSASDVAFAVQAIAGINYDLTSHWTLFTEYKFVAAIDPDFTYHNVYVAQDSLRYDPSFFGQHLITAGVKYNF